MSRFKINLNARRDALGLTVRDVAAELARRGFDAPYPTVAGWFNTHRGERWKVKELQAVLDILQTTLEEMASGEAVLIEEPIPATAAKKLRNLSPEQQQSILALIESMQPKS